MLQSYIAHPRRERIVSGGFSENTEEVHMNKVRATAFRKTTKNPDSLKTSGLLTPLKVKLMILLCPPEESMHFHYPLDPKKICVEKELYLNV